jgi:hypothetical protein
METGSSNREGKSYCGGLTGVISAGQGEGYYSLITLSESKYIRKQTSPISINIYFLSSFPVFYQAAPIRRGGVSEVLLFEKPLSSRSRFDKRP